MPTWKKWLIQTTNGSEPEPVYAERRILRGEGKGTSDLGAPAVLNLCKKRGIDPSEIDCLICCTVTPDMIFPATANIICDKIGAINAWSFDLGAACSGFLYGVNNRRACTLKVADIKKWWLWVPIK